MITDRADVLTNCVKAFDVLWKALKRLPVNLDEDEFGSVKIMLTNSPASSSPNKHGAFNGGLMVHTMYVVAVALKLADILIPSFNKKCVAFVAMVHDLAKSGSYKPNLLKNGSQSESKPFERKDDLIPMSDPVKTLAFVAKCWPNLTDIEIQAIVYHDGQYVPANREVAMNEHPLTLILHWADVWSARFLDNGESKLWMPESMIGEIDPLEIVKEFFGK